MKRLRSFLILLSALFLSACRGLRGDDAANTVQSQLLYQGEGVHVISAESGTATELRIQRSGKLNVWALSADQYDYLVHDKTLIFADHTGDYMSVPLGTTSPSALSPDGRYATRVADRQLSLRRVDQADAQPIAENVWHAGFWSPDSQRFVLQRQQDETRQYILYEVATGEQTAVIETTAAWQLPQWSADSKTLSFIVGEEAAQVLHRYSAESGELTTLPIAVPELNALYPVGDTDKLIAQSSAGAIMQIDAAEDTVTTLFETPYAITNLTIAPDSRGLFAFVNNWNRPNAIDVLHIPFEGGEIATHTVEVPSKLVQGIAFAPTSDKVAFILGPHRPDDGVRRLFRWDLVGEPTAVLPVGGGGAATFVWSADGAAIYAMAALEAACEDKRKFSIALVPTIVKELHCQFGLYRIDDAGYQRVGTFESPALATFPTRLSWLP